MNTNTTNAKHLPQEIVGELQDIIADINRFLLDWSSRAAHIAATKHSIAEPDAALTQQIAQFQAEQQSWESQMRFEKQQLEATANQLTAAWIRLEQEQRGQLQAGTTLPSMVLAEQVVAETRDLIDARIYPVQSVIEPIPSRGVGAERVNRPPDLIPREAAVRQFEKLKHSISSCSSSST